MLGIALISVMGIGFGSASISSINTYFPNTCVQIIQTCNNNCTFNNISSILITNPTNPEIDQYSPNLVLNSVDNITYSYRDCNTSLNGIYAVNGYGNDQGTISPWNYTFEIQGVSLVVMIILMIICYGLGIFGFFIWKERWFSFAGGVLMILLGIFLTQYGIDIYKNTMTDAIGGFTLVIGFVFMLVPILEDLRENVNWFFNN